MKKYIKKVIPKNIISFAKSIYSSNSAKETFTTIYKKNHWKSKESISGTGSSLSQTKTIINGIDSLINEFNIKTVLDLPCGDFNWMKYVDFKNIDYTGADIVDELIDVNKNTYTTNNIHFKTIDLISDNLSYYDLIINRDCLVHLSFEDIQKCIQRIKESNSKYLLTTTFINRELNEDIITGDWRTLNFKIEPFKFPEPKMIINENCNERDNKYKDKSLGLYLIEDILLP
jgi:2-polyprenyl-3-methyl-5-hydroxy-6-metoxy-1,4-benzoquinol methylase